MKIIGITGATSGIGLAITEKFASLGWQCIITGRKMDILEELKSTLETKYPTKILPLCFDVRNSKEVISKFEYLPVEWKNIDTLVNNAGLALGREKISEGLIDDWDTMIDTNLKGLLYVTKAVLPNMVSNKKGHIINIGSIAGKEVYPSGNVYCATKHAVDALGKSMRIDLVNYNIKVTTIHPGAVDTNFSKVRFKGDEDKASQVYEGFEPLHAVDIAEIAYFSATLPHHVCLNDIIVTSTAQANASIFNKFK